MPATKVVVNLPGVPTYDVRIGEGLLEGMGSRIVRTVPDASEVFLITDTNVGPLYATRVRESVKAAGLRLLDVTIPAGSDGRSVACAAELWTAMAGNNFGPNCVVVALGGRSVCNIAGFVATTYECGVSLVYAPTSLSAMVDFNLHERALVDAGGSTGVVGAFVQPSYVCASIDVLETLSSDAWSVGCSQMQHIAESHSADFAEWLTSNTEKLASRDTTVVQEAIMHCIVSQVDAYALG